MAIKTAQVSVGTSATELTGSDANPGNGSSILVKAPVDVFIGGSDVTTSNGFLVEAGTPFSYDFTGQSEQLFAVVASGTTTVSVLRGGV